MFFEFSGITGISEFRMVWTVIFYMQIYSLLKQGCSSGSGLQRTVGGREASFETRHRESFAKGLLLLVSGQAAPAQGCAEL